MKITNTSKDEIHLEWLSGLNPNAIENQEAKGQEQLINSKQLPIECSEQDKKKLELMGVIFGKVSENDSLFCEVILPKRWKKQSTDHSMWSDLINEKGDKVASIFYKAAFYDRKAHFYCND